MLYFQTDCIFAELHGLMFFLNAGYFEGMFYYMNPHHPATNSFAAHYKVNSYSDLVL